MPTPTLRRAYDSDLRFVAKLIAAGEKAGHFLGLGLPEEEHMKAMEMVLTHGSLVILEAATKQPTAYEAALCIVEISGERAGFLLEVSAYATTLDGKFFSPFQVAPGVAANEIYMIAVAPEHQGRGLAGFMLDLFIDSTKDKTVFARCRPASSTMLGMLERRGFQHRGNINEVVILRLPPR